ncbi:tRNA (pseudouridine(54)-N(1))-methyltransferase TrmY [Methanocella sp. CWC-04]|uniref:tRNA (pseudouridine(54)-N(1))-methyltransferase n=1 Tax=Methanooceanicella nereidis TaxID=2052831 RepID=A0AAP2RAK3_9EURY|nr:tRNA (pseudouridine(54)-N(1))-methyltransferase TrmY [Methanocella sp. CWC-04]MCD1293768.1 tRNA (pseudouridine(54)-N(1))-methyltransferase TrmY [Methanocella sp. CWC-04]
MRRFVIVGHKAVTMPKFSLNDLPGGAGRMDIIARCINSSLFLSHDLRRNVDTYAVLLGEPNPPVTVRFNGEKVRYLSPDERSAAALIKKALEKGAPMTGEEESTPGVYISKRSFEDTISGLDNIIYLHEEGEDIRNVRFTGDETFVLSDHQNLTPEEESVLERKGAKKVSLGDLLYHADHCIVMVNYELDRQGL